MIKYDQNKLIRSLNKHLGVRLTKKLKSLTAWELANPQSNKLTDRQRAKLNDVNIRFLLKISAIRILYEIIEDINLPTKEQFKGILSQYKKSMCTHSAFRLLSDYAQGNEHCLNINVALSIIKDYEQQINSSPINLG